MLLLAGSVPIDKMPLTIGPVDYSPDGITVDGQPLPINRGNEAMMTAACIACDHFGVERPVGMVAGDIGTRQGSEAIYNHLAKHLPEMGVDVMTLHYVMPDIKLNNKVVETIKKMKNKPVLIADAGSMYVAKAGGHAEFYDIFTPDLGEVAFLADEKADHPSFTRGFIFHMESDTPELIRRAYEAGNAPPTMFVKGKTDYVCHNGKIVHTIDSPSVETMEPIGGTGDLITGMISGMVFAGKNHIEACLIAGRANRLAGELSNPTPATQIDSIIKFLPEALAKAASSVQ